MDLMYFTDSWGSERNFFAQAYFTSALLYFIICFPLARLARYLEIRSMRMPAPKKYCLRRKAHADIISPDFTPANTGFMLKGLGMTIVIAVLAILISMFSERSWL